MKNEKTLTERTEDLLEQITYVDFRTEIGIDKARQLIRRAFKNEQKLMREACAGELDKCTEFYIKPFNISKEYVLLDEAEKRIQNAEIK